MTESDYSLMKTPQKPLISVSKRGQYAIKCTDWSEWAYLLQSMHRGLIKSAMLPPTPPHKSTRTNSQTRNRLSSLFTHLHLHTGLLHKREQLDIDHTFLPEEGIPVPSFDLEPKSILNKSFVVCCFLKGTGKLIHQKVDVLIYKIFSHTGFHLIWKLHQEIHSCIFHSLTCQCVYSCRCPSLSPSPMCVYMCTWYQVCDGVIIQSSWQVKSPWKHCYWRRDTGFSCEHTHSPWDIR